MRRHWLEPYSLLPEQQRKWYDALGPSREVLQSPILALSVRRGLLSRNGRGTEMVDFLPCPEGGGRGLASPRVRYCWLNPSRAKDFGRPLLGCAVSRRGLGGRRGRGGPRQRGFHCGQDSRQHAEGP